MSEVGRGALEQSILAAFRTFALKPNDERDFGRLRHGNVDLPMDGANDVLRGIRWARERDGRLNANFGDGLMMIMDWAPDHTLQVRVIHQWGASSHETSPHYNDQSPLYVAHGWRWQSW